jgi:hypothetical protein
MDLKICKYCYFWSFLIAKVEDDVVKAMCLNKNSLNNQKYTCGNNECQFWADGSFGVIDEP